MSRRPRTLAAGPLALAAGGRAAEPSPRVLVVEDNPTNQFVFSHFLRRIGLSFHMVGNGADALHAWQHGGYDLVLMDIEMPVMDGYDAARELRRREAAEARRPTPIIALSADALPANFDRARNCGIDDFITKPVELERLRLAILRATAGGDAA
jgi:CheY-like chemotaxis protein